MKSVNRSKHAQVFIFEKNKKHHQNALRLKILDFVRGPQGRLSRLVWLHRAGLG